MMNQVQFVNFSSSHDLNRMVAGEQFTATWRVRNGGTTTWGQGYEVRHIHAAQGSTLMTGQSQFDLAAVSSRATVAPGEEAEITLTMTAPAPRDRRYFTDWQLHDSQGRPFGDIIWLRVVTVAPPPPPPSGHLTSDSQYIDDHTIPDGTPLEEGTAFLKQWVVRNNGQRKWSDNYRLVFVNGDMSMAGSATHRVPEANPGDEVVLSIEMVAPPARSQPYISSWRLHDDRNIPFGDHFWVKFHSTAKVSGFGVTPYSQNDPRWKNHILGHGPRTFSQFGCLVACFSMMLSGFGEDIDPLTLNDRLLPIPNHGFSGSDVFFMGPAVLIDHVKYWGNFTTHSGIPHAQHDANLIGRIDEYLGRGDAVILQVDTEPNTPYNFRLNQHWVLALARRGDDYLVLDPIDGQAISLLSKYGQQHRPQSPEQALREAIKSALFYRSTRVSRPVEPPPAVDPTGSSHIGETELAYTGPDWSFNRCLIGLHDRADRHPQPADHAIARGRFESIKVQSGVQVADMQAYNAQFYLCRLFESWHGRHVPVEAFVETISHDIERLVNAGVEYFEFHNEPNLTHEGLNAHGVPGSWRNGAEFAQYFIEGRKLLRRRFPGIKVGFPGLSPGASTAYQFGHDRGFRMDHREFLNGAVAAIREADFLCVHAYYINMEEVRRVALAEVQMYRQRWPRKLLFVTEFSNPNPGHNIPAADRGRQAKEFYRLVGEIPGVGAAYYFIVSGTGWDHQALRHNADGRSTGMIETMF
jgi:hypothetical protein